MRRYLYVVVLAVSLCPLLAEAVTRDEFLVRTTQDYVRLCSTNPSDPLYAAAMGFCHGYGVGAFHYYLATTLLSHDCGYSPHGIRLPSGSSPAPG